MDNRTIDCQSKFDKNKSDIEHHCRQYLFCHSWVALAVSLLARRSGRQDSFFNKRTPRYVQIKSDTQTEGQTQYDKGIKF